MGGRDDGMPPELYAMKFKMGTKEFHHCSEIPMPENDNQQPPSTEHWFALSRPKNVNKIRAIFKEPRIDQVTPNLFTSILEAR
jgi:hypothetical protein